MYFCDIYLDLEWLKEKNWKLPESISRSNGLALDGKTEIEFLFFGNSIKITHVRLIIFEKNIDLVSKLIDENQKFWINSIEIATAIGSRFQSTAVELPSVPLKIFVSYGEFNPNDNTVVQMEATIIWNDFNPEIIAKLSTAWNPEFHHHLFYAAKCANYEFPLDVRWLSAYRLLEWHFCRGKVGLQNSQKWQEFLIMNGEPLDKFLRKNQKRWNFVESVRALCAHSLLQEVKDGDLVALTFEIILEFVAKILTKARQDGFILS